MPTFLTGGHDTKEQVLTANNNSNDTCTSPAVTNKYFRYSDSQQRVIASCILISMLSTAYRVLHIA